MRNPVAKFFYKGSHSHPVRVTLLIISDFKDILTGYVLRSGKSVFNTDNAPIKSYRKDKIARYGDYCRLRGSKINRNKNSETTTLRRMGLTRLLKEGV